MAISLFTTDRLPIVDGLAELPNVPISGIYSCQAIVYADGGRAEDHDGVSIVQIDGIYCAQFSTNVSGDAVVSYFIG